MYNTKLVTMQIYYQTSTWILYYNAVYRPGANVLGIRVLEYIFEVLVLVEIMDHVLVLVLVLVKMYSAPGLAV